MTTVPKARRDNMRSLMPSHGDHSGVNREATRDLLDHIDGAEKEIRKLRDLVELRTLERDEARDDAAHFKQAYESASAQATRFAERLGAQSRSGFEVPTPVVLHELIMKAVAEGLRWPAVGADVPGERAWDHMMACPQARYRATCGRAGYVLRSGMWRGALSLVDVADSRALFTAGCDCNGWTFTRLPDAPVSP